MRMRILIVHADDQITRVIQPVLEQADYEVYTTADHHSALSALELYRPDLLLLVQSQAVQAYIDLIRTVRRDATFSSLPLLVIANEASDTDIVVELEAGADDIMVTPVDLPQLVARLRALLRRAYRPPRRQAILQVGDLYLDVARHEITCAGVPLDLTPTEFNLLQALMEHPGYVFSRTALLGYGFCRSAHINERTLDSHIKNLRRKLADDPDHPLYIETVYGVGYRMLPAARA